MSSHEVIKQTGPDVQVVTRNVVGVFEQRDVANAAVTSLLHAGFSQEAISIVSKAPGDAPEVGTDDTQASKGLAVGGLGGALIGGTIGLGLLVIPGVGPILASAQIASMIAGAVAGGTAGAFVGSFVGLGIPTEHGERYEAAVRSGSMLVTVSVTNEADALRVAEDLKSMGAQETAIYQPAL